MMPGSLSMSRFPMFLTLLVTLSAARGGGDEADPLRLSGTVMTASGEGVAIVEADDGRSYRYRAGDSIVGWGTVTRIEQGRIHLQTDAGEKAVVLSGGAPQPRIPAAGPLGPAWAEPVNVVATPELLAELGELAADPVGRGDDLNRLLFHIVDIPLGEQIFEVNSLPLADDATTARMIIDELRQGNMVSLRVGDGNHLRSVYLGLQPSGEGDAE